MRPKLVSILLNLILTRPMRIDEKRYSAPGSLDEETQLKMRIKSIELVAITHENSALAVTI